MSKDLNQCNFIGRLGKEVDIKYSAGGSAVAKFSIACGDDYKDKQGQKVEQTNWINIVMFGKLAEIAGQYLKKGSQIHVSGKQVTSKWQDQNGQDRYSTEIVANEMQMLWNKQDSGASNQNQTTQNQAQQPANNFDSPLVDDGYSDIPF